MAMRLGGWATRVLEGTIVACLALMAVLVFTNVVLRYAFDSGIAVSEELSRLLFVWLIFLGAILASRKRAHLGFDSLLGRLPEGPRRAVVVLNGALMLATCAFFVIGGWKQTLINLDNSYPVLGIPYAWMYGVAIVFGLGMGLSILLNLRDTLLGRIDEHSPGLTQNLKDRVRDQMAQIPPRDPDA